MQYEETLNLDLVIIKKFGMLGIAAPMNQDDLDDRLAQIEEKRQQFEANAADELNKQIAEMDLAANDEENFEDAEPAEEEYQPQQRGRGGRGNRGGYRGGRSGPAGRGRGRGASSFQVRSEFDGDDDDEIVYSAPANKPKRNQKQKQEDLKKDEENYPAL